MKKFTVVIYCGIYCGAFAVVFLWRLKVCGAHYRFGSERAGMIIISVKKAEPRKNIRIAVFCA